jgi:prevent-host-death family protein
VDKAVGVRELKTRLGRYLREVRLGRTIVVTDRGEPVAELRPIVLEASGPAAEVDRLVALGRLTRAAKGPLPPFRPVKRKGRSLSDAVVEDREDRF